jgi:hypothetical protein
MYENKYNVAMRYNLVNVQTHNSVASTLKWQPGYTLYDTTKKIFVSFRT